MVLGALAYANVSTTTALASSGTLGALFRAHLFSGDDGVCDAAGFACACALASSGIGLSIVGHALTPPPDEEVPAGKVIVDLLVDAFSSGDVACSERAACMMERLLRGDATAKELAAAIPLSGGRKLFEFAASIAIVPNAPSSALLMLFSWAGGSPALAARLFSLIRGGAASQPAASDSLAAGRVAQLEAENNRLRAEASRASEALLGVVALLTSKQKICVCAQS